MVYGKKQAVMTRGFASLTLVCLHLFCRLGNDILYTPLIWLNSEKPFVYWIGFFCEICVPIYSMCAGYAQHIIYEKGNATFRKNGKRILKLLENYWIILILACSIGLIMGNPNIPKDFGSFLRNVFLVGRYQPAWWYINAYCLVLLIPQKLFMKPIKRINAYLGIAGCLVLLAIWYLLTRFNIVDFESRYYALNFVVETAKDLMKVVPYYFIGAFMHKENIFDKADTYLNKIKKPKWRNALLLACCAVIFVVVNLLEKAVLMGAVSILIMLIFNLIKMPKFVEKIFFFFGKHSTNIWLIHMFFYIVLFQDFIWIAKYPLPILLFMLALCIGASYIIMYIQKGIDLSIGFLKKKLKKTPKQLV